MVIVLILAMLLAEPHVSYSLLVKRPATSVDHERDHEKINGSMNDSVHFFVLKNIVPKRNRSGLS